MSPDTTERGETAGAGAPGPAGSKRALLDTEDWKDVPGRKTICEYHKDGLPDGVCREREVDDLESFSKYWKGRGQGKLHSEYHKDGAPYLEEPSEWDGHDPGQNVRHPKAAAAAATPAGDGERQPAPPEPSDRRAPAPVERLIDVPSIELATYAMFRSLVGRGIYLPLKREGVLDMEIIVKDRDIVLNTNRVQLELPSLAIWKIIFAYKGEPVVEYGRGVKNNLKIHRWRLFKLLLHMWWRGRRKAREVEKQRGAGK